MAFALPLLGSHPLSLGLCLDVLEEPSTHREKKQTDGRAHELLRKRAHDHTEVTLAIHKLLLLSLSSAIVHIVA